MMRLFGIQLTTACKLRARKEKANTNRIFSHLVAQIIQLSFKEITKKNSTNTFKTGKFKNMDRHKKTIINADFEAKFDAYLFIIIDIIIVIIISCIDIIISCR